MNFSSPPMDSFLSVWVICSMLTTLYSRSQTQQTPAWINTGSALGAVGSRTETNSLSIAGNNQMYTTPQAKVVLVEDENRLLGIAKKDIHPSCNAYTNILIVSAFLYSCCWYAGDGEVFAFGWNKNGQLGVPPSEDVTVPHPLARTLSHCATKIAKVSCGWNHTLAIGDGGSLIVWGSNAFGQLGAPDVAKQTDRPIILQQQVFSNSRILDIAAGLRHSMAVTGILHVGCMPTCVPVFGWCYVGQTEF